MKNMVNILKSKLFSQSTDTVEPIFLHHTPDVQTHWCEVQTDLDEEIARS